METSETRKITPGPGSYKKGSDFGYVDMDPVYKFSKKMKNGSLNRTIAWVTT
jgi:hypothetical protein